MFDGPVEQLNSLINIPSVESAPTSLQRLLVTVTLNKRQTESTRVLEGSDWLWNDQLSHWQGRFNKARRLLFLLWGKAAPEKRKNAGRATAIFFLSSTVQARKSSTALLYPSDYSAVQNSFPNLCLCFLELKPSWNLHSRSPWLHSVWKHIELNGASARANMSSSPDERKWRKISGSLSAS